MNLKIAPGLSLPTDVVTQTFAILAIRRVGKTYTASVLAEEMMRAGLPFVVLDPTGAWWGLRASADGKSEGYPVVIIGGAHGDVPLEPTAGKVLADLAVDHPGWYVIDMSQTASRAEQDRIARDFAEQLYRQKASATFPLHLFVDEADSFAPQQAFPDQKPMLGAFEALVRRGGIRGIGTTLITQRPAVLNKNLLTQADNLIVLRITSPQDRTAIDDWVKGNGTKEERDTMMNSLASLQQGEAWFWSPGTMSLFQKIKIRERETFNSSATPKPGEHRVEPQRLAAVDLESLRDKIQATIEKAKADDPKLLRQRIAELEKQLRQTSVDDGAIEQAVYETEQRLTNAYTDGLIAMEREYRAVIQSLLERLAGLVGEIQEISKMTVPAAGRFTMPSPAAKPAPVKAVTAAPVAQVRNPQSAIQAAAAEMSKAERVVLTALAQYPNGRTKVQLGVLTGYSPTSGGFNSTLASLRAKGWIDGLRITQQGIDALGDFEPLPTGFALRCYWLARLTGCSRALLEHLSAVHPGSMSKESLAKATGYSGTSGGFNSALAELRTLELITKGREIKASDVLFED